MQEIFAWKQNFQNRFIRGNLIRINFIDKHISRIENNKLEWDIDDRKCYY